MIKNINTVLLNTLFHYVKKSGGHGSNEHNPSYQIERIKIDPKIEIIGVRMTLDHFNRLRGVQFLLSDGSETPFIGKAPQSGYMMEQVNFKPNQELLGFFGYKTENEIESLGVKVIIKKGTNLA